MTTNFQCGVESRRHAAFDASDYSNPYASLANSYGNDLRKNRPGLIGESKKPDSGSGAPPLETKSRPCAGRLALQVSAADVLGNGLRRDRLGFRLASGEAKVLGRRANDTQLNHVADLFDTLAEVGIRLDDDLGVARIVAADQRGGQSVFGHDDLRVSRDGGPRRAAVKCGRFAGVGFRRERHFDLLLVTNFEFQRHIFGFVFWLADDETKSTGASACIAAFGECFERFALNVEGEFQDSLNPSFPCVMVFLAIAHRIGLCMSNATKAMGITTQRLRQVFPMNPLANLPDGLENNSVFFGQYEVRFAARPDRNYVLSRQFGSGVQLPARGAVAWPNPPFAASILHVVAVASAKKVLRIYAGRIVAFVADLKLAGMTNPQEIGKPVRGDEARALTNIPVSASVFSASPIPATRNRINLNPVEDELLVVSESFHAVRFENHRPRRTAAVLTHGGNPVLRIDGDDGEFSASAVRRNPDPDALSFQD